MHTWDIKKWEKLDLNLKEIFCVTQLNSLNLQLALFLLFFEGCICFRNSKTDVTENINLNLHANMPNKRSLIPT